MDIKAASSGLEASDLPLMCGIIFVYMLVEGFGEIILIQNLSIEYSIRRFWITTGKGWERGRPQSRWREVRCDAPTLRGENLTLLSVSLETARACQTMEPIIQYTGMDNGTLLDILLFNTVSALIYIGRVHAYCVHLRQ